MQTGYNEQIVVDNKNGLIIAVDVTTEANDQKQLIPMINQTQTNLQNALNITNEETEQIMQNLDILADNGYYTNQTVHDIYEEEKYSILMPNREQAGKQKDCIRLHSQRKTYTNKEDGYSKHN